MSESELLLLASEYQNRVWVLQTWSVSIAVALFTMSYLVGKKLTSSQLYFVLVTYVLYTSVMIRNSMRINSGQIAIREEILALQNAGLELSAVSVQFLENYAGIASLPNLFLEVAYQILLFIGAIIYLISQYLSGKKKRANGT